MPISNENKAEGAFKLKLKIGEILRISWNELFATFLMKCTEFNAFHTQKTWLNLTNTSWVESESMNSGTIIVVRCSLLTLPRSKLKDGNQVFFSSTVICQPNKRVDAKQWNEISTPNEANNWKIRTNNTAVLYLCWTDVHMEANLLERHEIENERVRKRKKKIDREKTAFYVNHIFFRLHCIKITSFFFLSIFKR